MKITKSQLKQIIKEEIASVDEGFGTRFMSKGLGRVFGKENKQLAKWLDKMKRLIAFLKDDSGTYDDEEKYEAYKEHEKKKRELRDKDKDLYNAMFVYIADGDQEKEYEALNKELYTAYGDFQDNADYRVKAAYEKKEEPASSTMSDAEYEKIVRQSRGEIGGARKKSKFDKWISDDESDPAYNYMTRMEEKKLRKLVKEAIKETKK